MKTTTLQLKWAFLSVLFILMLSVAGVTNAFAHSFSMGDLNYSNNGNGSIMSVMNHRQLGPRSEELTVHDGTTTNSYVPFYGLWVDDYTRSEMIYPATELFAMTDTDINSLTFYKNSTNTNSWGSTSFQVYLKEVDSITLSAYIGMEDATIVYEGGIDAAGGEIQVTINFTTPYHYNGGNLLVGIYETVTGSYSSAYWYGESVTGASASGYNASDPASATFNQRNFLPKTTFTYDITVPTNLIITPNPVAMGYRPNGAWMRPFEVNIFNEGGGTTINSISVNNPFFQIESIELPYSLDYNLNINLNLSTNSTGSGLVNANLVVNYGENEEVQFDVTATAYDPVSPDVWELAQLVTSFPYTVTLNENNTPLYDNYRLPPTYIEDGADAVYKLVFTEDTYLNASVTSGENGKVALYPENFMGLGGPDLGNNYTGPNNGGPFMAMIGDMNSTTTSTYFPYHSFWNYSLGENLFLASELVEAGVTTASMTSLSWYVASMSNTTPQNNISIWMANVSDEALTSTSHTTSGMTLVYTGNNVLPVAGQWNEFVFNAGNFAWDGHSNVLILCQRNNGSYQGSISWQTHNPGFTAMCYAYSDINGGYDATSQTYSMNTSSTNRPNIIMKSGNRSISCRELSTRTNEHGANRNTNAELNREGWLYYDNSTYATNVGAGGEIYWGTMFPASMITENSLTKVALYENSNNTGTITLNVYSGGDTAPGTQIYTQDFTPMGGDAFHEATLASPVTIDPSQNLWIVFHQTGDTYPAAVCEGTSYPNNRWVSLDGTTWYDLAEAGLPGYEWMIRAYIEGNLANVSIQNLTVTPGTYYLVASSTSDEFIVEINTDEVPCPEPAYNIFPANYAEVNPNRTIVLSWQFGQRTTEYKLMFGTTENCEQTLVDWTRELSCQYTLPALYDDMTFYWKVVERNDGCSDGVESPVWSFTTRLNTPQNLYAEEYFIMEGNSAVLYWTAPNRALQYYNVYQDGELIGNTTDTYYVVDGLSYNMNGYAFYVTGVFDAGESDPSNYVYVYVSGMGSVEGHVYEQDGSTGIENATVSFVGYDEDGYYNSYSFTTDADGYYEGTLRAGFYTATASCVGYQDKQYANVVGIVFNELTNGIDFSMDEIFNPVSTVVAEYYPDVEDPNSPYVKIHWGTPSSATFDFEDSSMQGWTTIDADGDGYTWMLATETIGTGYGYNGSNDCVLSQSWYSGTVLYPDNYFVSPLVSLGGSISFWACAQDASYAAEHFGVAVSTTSNIDPNAFTILSEWTMSAKATSNPEINMIDTQAPLSSRSNNRTQGAWYQFTVDLSAYSGMGYVAIRHFNCSDMFYLDVDDIVIEAPFRIAPTRAFSHYKVYRTNAYNSGPYNVENTVLLADNVTDTVSIDATWQDVEAGVYKFGVSCVYEGNRESEISWGELNQLQPMPNRSSILYQATEGTIRENSVYDFDDSSMQGWTTIDADGDGYTWVSSAAPGIYHNSGVDLTGTGHNGSAHYVISASWANGLGQVLYPDNYLVSPQIALGGSISFWACAQDASYAADHFGVAVSTTSNIDPNAFTTIQEWTMTAKSTSNVISIGRNGNTRAQGNWYQYTVDLSSYSGMGYVAIRHFNCSDQFILNVDDISIEEGVGSVQEPRESEIVWSNFLDKDMYLVNGDVNLTVALNSGDSPAGTTVSFTNLNNYEQGLYPVDDVVLDASGYYVWDNFRKGDYQVTVTKEGYATFTENVSIWEATSLSYVLEEATQEPTNLYVSSTGWAKWNGKGDDLNLMGSGSSFNVDFEEGLPEGWEIIDVNGDGYTWTLTSDIPSTWSYYASLALDWYHNGSNAICSGSYINGVGALTPDEYLISPEVNLANGSQLSFWVAAADVNYAADHFGVFVSTTGTDPSDFQSVQEWTLTAKRDGLAGGPASRNGKGLRLGNWYNYSIDLSAYAGNARYIAFRHYNCYDQYIMCLDDIELTTGRNGDRHFMYNQVVLTDMQNNVLYAGNTTNKYYQLYVDNLTEGETYHCKVASVYSSGMTEWAETDWVYQACDNYEGASNLTAETTEEGNLISWTYPENERNGNRDMLLSITDDLNDGLIAYYPFDGNANDASGNGNHGVLGGSNGGPTLTTDRFGNANSCYEFGGYYNPNWIDVPNSNSLLLDTTVSVSFWVQECYRGGMDGWGSFSSSDYNYGVIAKGGDGWSCPPGLWIFTNHNSNNAEGFLGTIANNSVSNGNYVFPDIGPRTNWVNDCDWMHCVVVIDGRHLTFYHNGVVAMDTIVQNCPDFSAANNQDMHIGIEGGHYWNPRDGKLDDIAIYNRALTALEVLNLYGSNSVLGAMVYRNNELLGFTSDNSFLDEGEMGSHQYDIRVVYGGSANCPSNNIYYSMSCPQSISSGEEDHWNVDIYQYPYNMSVTGIIQINGVEQQTPALEIGAFCGGECRGTQRLTYFPQVDRYLVFFTLYGDAGDVMSFRLYDHSVGEELSLSCSSTISFVPDGFMGTPFDPYVFDFSNNMTVEQVSNFSQGYNWWSTYIEQESMDGLGMLEEGLGDNGVSIRSQVGFTDYYQGYGWYGSLASINNESSYRVITNAPCTVTMTGNAAVPSQHPIMLSQGWTWIGYVSSTAMSVDAAMADVDAMAGDKLKSQQGYADFYPGYGWFGSLNTIEPGMGLMYYSANGASVPFTYPDSGRGGEQNLTAKDNHWKPNVYAYPDNMTVMAVVDLNDVELTSDNYELSAFATNGECRGSVRLTYAEPLRRHVAFLTISGKDAAELSFRLYDTETGMEYYDAEESLDFVANAIVGEADDLYVVHFRGTTNMDEFANRVRIYPNPVNGGERFSIGMDADIKTPVRVEIVNALGSVVSVETSTQNPTSIVAPITAGVYTVRIITEGKNTQCRKLIVK